MPGWNVRQGKVNIDLNLPWPNEQILDLDHPPTNEHLVLQDLISSRASSLNFRRGC